MKKQYKITRESDGYVLSRGGIINDKVMVLFAPFDPKQSTPFRFSSKATATDLADALAKQYGVAFRVERV